MNQVILMGRVTKDVDIRYTQGANSMCVARYSLAVDRRGKDNGADFISCIAFGKAAEFAERFLHKGIKIAVVGHIQTGSYTKQDGTKVYTTDVIVDQHEFCESRKDVPSPTNAPEGFTAVAEGFEAIPDNAEGEGMPWV